MKEKRARVPLRLIRLAPVGAMLLMLSAPTAMADSAQAETGEISKTVYGAGAVQPASQSGVYAEIDATLSEVLVEMGDEVKAGDIVARLQNDELEAEISQLEYDLQQAQAAVKAVETHTQYIYKEVQTEETSGRSGRGGGGPGGAGAPAGEEAPAETEGSGEAETSSEESSEPEVRRYSNEITIYAPTAGRVMALYIEAGDDALAVYRDKGAVAILSTDGRMKVELSDLDGTELSLGETVLVTGSGIDAQGTVVSVTRRGTEAVIQVVGDEYPMDAPVTVSKLTGEAVSEGVLEINKPMAVSAYGGTIKGVAVKVGDTVKRQQVIARIVWDEIPLYIDNALVLRDYVKAQMALESAVEKREALTVVAPCDGIVASIDAQTDDEVTGGTRIMTIVEDAGMMLSLAVDELDIVKVQPGQAVSISVDALPDLTLTGTVEKIAPLGNVGTGVTTYDVYITLEEEDERVLGGMNVSGEIVVETAQDAVLIPTDALKKGADGYYVTLEDGTDRAVETGIMTDDRVQIVSGLAAGDTVVY